MNTTTNVMLGEEDQPMWNSYLYVLQEEAPRPKPVYCRIPEITKSRPPYFGEEFHGLISREEGEARCREEGNFLIRESSERGRYALVLRILGVVKNFRLYWENEQHFVGDKKFPNIYALVEDGLITMYVEGKAENYIKNMPQTRKPIYSSLSRSRQFLCQRSTSHISDPRNYQLRDQPVVLIGEEGRNSPRHAHNGRNTEEAALPYPHNPQLMDNRSLEPARFHNQAYTNGSNAKAKQYYNPSIPQGRSIIQSLKNSVPPPANHFHSMNMMQPSISSPNMNLHSTVGGGGTKKNLTPTSSDERKRPKPKRIAKEEYRVAQYPFVDPRPHLPMQVIEHRRSPSNSSTSTSDSEGHRGFASPNHQPHINGGFNRSFNGPIMQPSTARHHSPMRRNNSDPTQKQMPYHLMEARHIQTNVAHVRQLSGGSTSGSSVTSSIDATTQNGEANNNNESEGRNKQPAAPALLPRYNRTDGKVKLDANDNQVRLTTDNQQDLLRGQYPRNSPVHNFPGQNMTPPSTFEELKKSYRQLEEATDDESRKEARDEVMTLRGDQRIKTKKLTRSNTTVGVAIRPNSGRTARPLPINIHDRQYSEPVELFQKLPPNNRSSPVNEAAPTLSNSAIYREQNSAVRDELRKKFVRRQPDQQSGFEHVLSQDPRATGSSGSCDSSLSSVSIGSSVHHLQDPFYKLSDSISHVSSEEWMPEERDSSPSPHNTSHRSCSSDDNMTSLRHDRLQPRQGAINDWQQRPSPLVSKNSHGRPQKEIFDVVAPLAQLPEGVHLQTEVSPRRKSSDFDTTSKSKIDPTSKFRHHSENSFEESSTIITPPLTNGNGMSPNRKPVLERRATTGCEPNKKDLDRHLGRIIEPVSPTKKKTASRSQSGPSPRKGKKSPDGMKSPHLSHQRSISAIRCMDGVPNYEKDHDFKSHTYRGLQWCEYCGNFMWGIIQQGLQCIDCGLNVHKQCSNLVPSDCQPALKHVKTVFGIDLTTLVKLHGTERPIVVDMCIEEIESRGMNSEGIYRVSGSQDDIQELKLDFDRNGHDVDLSQFDDINTIAGVMKQYLRDLPVPLIPYKLYSRFMNAQKLSTADKLQAICLALDAMPPAHFQTLKHLINHLGRICDRRAHNQMDSHNLGIVFGPTTLREPEKGVSKKSRIDEKSRIDDAQVQGEIIMTIIDNRNLLFHQQAEISFINQIHR